jgi:mannose-1-phosphate guanylyltransferase/mannose-6-phosphate isomerase
MRILLMAGGSGTRLWPLSTEERPKQFLPLLSDRSLIAETWDRVAPLSGDVWAATSERYVDLLRRELPALPASRVLAEPARRNSGPALLAAAVRFRDGGDPVTAAIPSDQTVADDDAFRRALSAAAALADSGSVVILAVVPSRGEPDFGYVELDGDRVTRFTEKPDAARAREWAGDGRHFWNAGIFVFRPSRLLAEARRAAPELVAGVERWVASGSRGDYEALPNISIDFALIEKASDVRAVPLDAGWSDVGTWRSVRDLRGADGAGNLVVAPGPVVAPGVRDTAIVVARDGTLVLPLDREGELRSAVAALASREDAS